MSKDTKRNTVKKNFFQSILALSFGASLLAGCPGGEDPEDNDPNPDNEDIVEVAAEISEDTTWTSDKIWRISQNTFVTGGTLTIEPGTVVMGEGSSALVISRDAKIHAKGTAAAPIVMTSAKVEGERTPGDWGGLVVLGRAAINSAGGEQQVEGFPANTPSTLFGGGANPDDAHDCGVMEYLRIEFAGYILAGDNETNGLTLAGCGTDTDVNHVHVHMGSDDGVEIFGGSVNIRNIVISRVQDDSLDWDLGWTGKAQFVVIQQDPVHGNYGFEADSNGSTPNEAPISNPELYNFTLIGTGGAPSSKEQAGMLLREGTGGRMANFIVTEFASYAIDIAGRATIERSFEVTGAAPAHVFVLKPENEQQLYLANSVFFRNGYDANGELIEGGNVFAPVEPPMEDGAVREKGDIAFDQEAFFHMAEYGNEFGVDPQLGAPLDLEAPDFKPTAGSPVLTGGIAPPNDGFFDPSATFRGAIGDTDWTAGWTDYPVN